MKFNTVKPNKKKGYIYGKQYLLRQIKLCSASGLEINHMIISENYFQTIPSFQNICRSKIFNAFYNDIID